MNIIRNEKGVMFMKVIPSVVNGMLSNLEGKVTIKKFKDGTSKRCFVLVSDQTISNDYLGTIYLWKGSYIEL